MYRTRRRKRKLRVLRMIICLLILAICVVLLWKAGSGLIATISKELSPQVSAESHSTATAGGYEEVSQNEQALHNGDLILVNNQYAYSGSEQTLVSIYDSKNDAYFVKDKNVQAAQYIMEPLNALLQEFNTQKNVKNTMIISGYRSIEKQTQLYNDDLAQTGQSTSKLVTKPGYSEHHTGLAVDFGLYNDGTLGQRSSEYDGSGDYAWLNQNCYQYGFVVRYDQSKAAITGIDNEPWHFRYVGKPHAQVMVEHNFCLEEYIDFLKQYPYDAEHLTVTDFDSVQYEIYYVKAENGTTNVPIPKDQDYTISGNNVDGFIVTAQTA